MKRVIKPFLILQIIYLFMIFLFTKNIVDYVFGKTEYLSNSNNETKDYQMKILHKNEIHRDYFTQPLIITTVICGDRFNESMNMIKSSLLFNSSRIKIIVFADKADRKLVRKIEQNFKKFDFNNTFDVRLVKLPVAIEDPGKNLTNFKSFITYFPV